MRKLLTILIFIAISMITTSKADAQTQYTVTAIKSARVIFNGGSAYLPAVVRAQAASVAVLRTAALTIPPIRGGSIAAALAMAGLTYGADRLFSYLASQGFPVDSSGVVQKTVTPSPVISLDTSNPGYAEILQMIANWQPPYAVGGDVTFYTTQADALSSIGTYTNAPASNYYGLYIKVTGYQDGKPITVIACYPLTGGTMITTQQPSTTTPATQQEIADVVSSGLQNGNSEAETAILDTLKRIETALNNVNDTLNTKSQMTEIKQTLNDSVSDQTKTDLDDQLTDPNAEQNYLDDSIATNSTDSGSNLTKEDVKDAVKNALDDTTGVSVPVDPTFETPQKLSLTSILQSWMQSINSLPIMNTLNGITITASGSPMLCINLPAKYGGSRCWDVSACQDTFNMIGTALLSMVSIMSFIYIFRG